jgi:DNA-binding transcriptional ArsR family regulator
MGARGVSTDLGSALFGKARRAVLGLLYARPDEAFYLRQITREVQAGQGAVQRELQRLADAGLLTREARGREIHYRANRACPIFAEVHGLVLKTVGLADVLRIALTPVQDALTLAVVYGSQAAGTASSGSDVDLLVVGTVDEIALHKAIGQAETRLARTVNYTLLSPREFGRQRRQRGGFVARVLAGPTIPILGSLDGA